MKIFCISRVLVGSLFVWFVIFSFGLPRLSSKTVLAVSESEISKFAIDTTPYVMYDYENCNPRTLKRPNGVTDCWQGSNIVLPNPRGEYAFGAFGSHLSVIWSETNQASGQFNWNGLDQALADAEAMEVRLADGSLLPYKPVILVLGEFLQNGSNPHDGSKDFTDYTPGFVRQLVGENQFAMSLPGCDTQDQAPYHNPQYQQYYRQWIQAFGQHLRVSPNRRVVQAVLMGAGLSDEATGSKNLADCLYGTEYANLHQAEYNAFYVTVMDWFKTALTNSGVTQPIVPILAQIASANPNNRNFYAQSALEKGIGIKVNSLSPSNENTINTRWRRVAGGRGGLHDYIAMTPLLVQPRAFEPAYFHSHPDPERCASLYCDNNSRYQGTYWNMLTALSLKADFFDFQKVFFQWKYEMGQQFTMPWFDQFVQESIGKAPNQSRTAWIAFAERFNTQDSYPNPRPVVPEQPGQGDYLPAEFTERGDRDFYLYRLGMNEDSSLIRAQGGLLTGDQENYALRTNGCYRNQQELPQQATTIMPGSQMRSNGVLSSTQFAHPFSTGGVTTEGNQQKYFVSLVVDDAVTRLRNGQVQLSVWYLDSGIDSFSVEYMNGAGQLQSRTVNKTNTRLWKEAVWQLNQGEIAFSHQLPGGADIRLNCNCQQQAGDDIFHMVKLRALSETSTPISPQTNLRFCGQSSGTCQNSADINQDGQVNLADFTILASQFLQTGTLSGDINCDQTVDMRDFTLFVSQLSI